MAAAIDALDDIARKGEKALVFLESLDLQDATQLPTILARRYGLKRLPMIINGEVGTDARQQRVDLFQREEGFDVMLLSPKAGGVGLTLTAANHVIHLSRWWNPAVEDQATDRAFRIGQKKNVFVHKFVCAGTLEERIDQMIEQKKALAESVIGTGEAWLTELSDDSLRELLVLRQEAVSNGSDSSDRSDRK